MPKQKRTGTILLKKTVSGPGLTAVIGTSIQDGGYMNQVLAKRSALSTSQKTSIFGTTNIATEKRNLSAARKSVQVESKILKIYLFTGATQVILTKSVISCTEIGETSVIGTFHGIVIEDCCLSIKLRI